MVDMRYILRKDQFFLSRTMYDHELGVVTLYQREITLGISWIGSCVVSALNGTESLKLGESMLYKFLNAVVYATRAKPVYSNET